MKELKLTLNPSSDNYQYIITNIQRGSDKQNKPSTSISLPGQSYRDNIMMGLQGQEADFTVDFKIHNDGTDKADGSISGGVYIKDESKTITEAKTVYDQIFYLKDVMQKPAFSATWTLDDPDDELYNNLQVFMGEIRVDLIDKDSPKWKDCSIGFIVGESI